MAFKDNATPEEIKEWERTLLSPDQKIVRDAALHLAIAVDYLDDYLTAFPPCNGREAMMTLSRDMNELSLFIETENKK